MPIALPTIPASASGVSKQRSAPNSSCRPAVARNTPAEPAHVLAQHHHARVAPHLEPQAVVDRLNDVHLWHVSDRPNTVTRGSSQVEAAARGFTAAPPVGPRLFGHADAALHDVSSAARWPTHPGTSGVEWKPTAGRCVVALKFAAARVDSSLKDPGVKTTKPSTPGTRVISVGGGKGGVGKSLVSTNLAVTIAQAGHEVVLCDLDLGAANLHLMLGLTHPRPGIATLLSGEGELEDALTADLDSPAAAAGGRRRHGRGRQHQPRPEAADHPQAAGVERGLRGDRRRRRRRLQRARLLRARSAADHRRHAAGDVDARRLRLLEGRRAADAAPPLVAQPAGRPAGAGAGQQGGRQGQGPAAADPRARRRLRRQGGADPEAVRRLPDRQPGGRSQPGGRAERRLEDGGGLPGHRPAHPGLDPLGPPPGGVGQRAQAADGPADPGRAPRDARLPQHRRHAAGGRRAPEEELLVELVDEGVAAPPPPLDPEAPEVDPTVAAAVSARAARPHRRRFRRAPARPPAIPPAPPLPRPAARPQPVAARPSRRGPRTARPGEAGRLRAPQPQAQARERGEKQKRAMDAEGRRRKITLPGMPYPRRSRASAAASARAAPLSAGGRRPGACPARGCGGCVPADRCRGSPRRRGSGPCRRSSGPAAIATWPP